MTWRRQGAGGRELGAGSLRGEGDLSGRCWAGLIDPDFGGDGLECKADPEGGAEELVWVCSMSANHRRGEKGCHDWADGGDGESGRVAANHPLAMLRKLAPQGMPERLSQRNQEKGSEERDGGLLIHAADGFSGGQSQPRDSHNGVGREENAPRPAVDLR